MFGLFKKKNTADDPVGGDDSPGVLPFGYKMSWLAVRGEPPQVMQALAIAEPRDVSWGEALRVVSILAYPQPQIRVFVTPAIAGWTLVVGWALPQLDRGMSDSFLRLTRALAPFERACFFATHRVVEGHAWAIIERGEIVRAFCYVGESGEVLVNEGAQTADEQSLGLPALGGLGPAEATEALFAAAEEGGELPTEEWVATLAQKWSVNPTALDTMGLPPSMVTLGSLPRELISP